MSPKHWPDSVSQGQARSGSSARLKPGVHVPRSCIGSELVEPGFPELPLLVPAGAGSFGSEPPEPGSSTARPPQAITPRRPSVESRSPTRLIIPLPMWRRGRIDHIGSSGGYLGVESEGSSTPKYGKLR
jgi:hypothetical protein